MRRGFTLIELMIVVGILGILGSVAVPNLSQTVYRSRCKTETFRAANAINQARNIARARHHCVDVTFNTLTISIKEWDDNSGACSGGSTTRNITFDGRYLKSMPSTSLSFNARGGTDLSGPWSVVLTSQVLQNVTVQVYPAIGSVRIRS